MILLNLYLRLNFRNTFDAMAAHCLAAERGGLIKKRKSSWVKLKAFPTNVGRPKNSNKENLGPLAAYCSIQKMLKLSPNILGLDAL